MKTNLNLHKTIVTAFALFLTVVIFSGCGKDDKTEGQSQANGSAAGTVNSGDKYFSEGVNAFNQKKFDDAIISFKKASEQGISAASFNIGAIYLNEKKNAPEAFQWFLKAAEQGLADAQFIVGGVYSLGEDNPTFGKSLNIKIDTDEAKKWFRKAAAQGDERAKRQLELLEKEERLANMAANGPDWDWIESQMRKDSGSKSGTKNSKDYETIADSARKAISEHQYSTAVSMLQDGAQNGHVRSQRYLGVCLLMLDREVEGASWIRKAAEAGDEVSQFNMAKCYNYGIGVKASIEEVRFWTQKLEDNGWEGVSLAMTFGGRNFKLEE